MRTGLYKLFYLFLELSRHLPVSSLRSGSPSLSLENKVSSLPKLIFCYFSRRHTFRNASARCSVCWYGGLTRLRTCVSADTGIGIARTHHQVDRRDSTQCTISFRRSRGDRIGKSRAFSYSSIGITWHFSANGRNNTPEPSNRRSRSGRPASSRTYYSVSAATTARSLISAGRWTSGRSPRIPRSSGVRQRQWAWWLWAERPSWVAPVTRVVRWGQVDLAGWRRTRRGLWQLERPLLAPGWLPPLTKHRRCCFQPRFHDFHDFRNPNSCQNQLTARSGPPCTRPGCPSPIPWTDASRQSPPCFFHPATSARSESPASSRNPTFRIYYCSFSRAGPSRSAGWQTRCIAESSAGIAVRRRAGSSACRGRQGWRRRSACRALEGSRPRRWRGAALRIPVGRRFCLMHQPRPCGRMG